MTSAVYMVAVRRPPGIRRRIAMPRTARSAALFAIGRPPSPEQASGCGSSARGCIELPGDSLRAESLRRCSRTRPPSTALVAHPLALLRGRTVDLALDREQRINELDRFDRDRPLGDPRPDQLASRVRAARRLEP